MLLLMKLRFHVDPTHQKQFFLSYQTLINVAAGEPHPQPRSQTATELDRTSIFGKITAQWRLAFDLVADRWRYLNHP
jgi:hypothetical protein